MSAETVSCTNNLQTFGENIREAPTPLAYVITESFCSVWSAACDVFTFHALWEKKEGNEDSITARTGTWCWEVVGLATSPLQILSTNIQRIFSACFPKNPTIKNWGDFNTNCANKTGLYFYESDNEKNKKLSDDKLEALKVVPAFLLLQPLELIHAVAVKTFDVITLHALWKSDAPGAFGERVLDWCRDAVGLAAIPLLFASRDLAWIANTFSLVNTTSWDGYNDKFFKWTNIKPLLG